MRLAIVFMVLAVVACSTADPPPLDDVSGAWTGTVDGSGGGVVVDADVDADFTQTGMDVSVRWAVKGRPRSWDNRSPSRRR